MKIHKIAWVLIIIGGINWLLTGLIPSWDLENYLGDVAVIVYILVGIAALYELFTHKSACKHCETRVAPTA